VYDFHLFLFYQFSVPKAPLNSTPQKAFSQHIPNFATRFDMISFSKLLLLQVAIRRKRAPTLTFRQPDFSQTNAGHWGPIQTFVIFISDVRQRNFRRSSETKYTDLKSNPFTP